MLWVLIVMVAVVEANHACSSDVVVIGAGPLGLKIAAELRSHQINIVHLEKGHVGNSIMQWFSGAVMHSGSNLVAVAGIPITEDECPRGECSKEEYLAYLRRAVVEEKLDVRTFDEVTELVQKRQIGCFQACIEAHRGILRVCSSKRLLLPVAASVNVDIFNRTRWDSRGISADGEQEIALIFLCGKENSDCSRTEVTRLLGRDLDGRKRRIIFAELGVSDKGETGLREPLARARALSLASIFAIYHSRYESHQADAAALIMEAKSCNVPTMVTLEPASDNEKEFGLRLVNISRAATFVMTDNMLAETILDILSALHSAGEDDAVLGRVLFLRALRRSELVADDFGKVIHHLHEAFDACASCPLPSDEELWGGEPTNVYHNGINAHLRMYAGLDDRKEVINVMERLVRSENPNRMKRVLNIGVDTYTIQYEYLVREWAPGAEWMTVELDSERAAMYGSRSGHSISLDMLKLEHSPLVAPSSVDLLICFGVIEAYSYDKWPDKKYNELIGGFLRGARRVLRNGGKLLLHIARRVRGDEVYSNQAFYFPSNLVLIERPFPRLFVLQKNGTSYAGSCK